MIFAEADYESYIGSPPPHPLQRWYDEAVTQLKLVFICFTEDLEPEQLEVLKKALMLQIEKNVKNQGVTQFSVGKFSATVKESNLTYSTVAIDMLRPIFNCNLWVGGVCGCI